MDYSSELDLRRVRANRLEAEYPRRVPRHRRPRIGLARPGADSEKASLLLGSVIAAPPRDMESRTPGGLDESN